MVAILLATFNGENFLRAQIESLLNQTYQAFVIVVRDDGSTDGTRNILEEYGLREASRFILLDSTERLGYTRNFHEILRLSPVVEYYAYCDQDDFWLPEKLEFAIGLLHGHKGPACYAAPPRIVDQNLKDLSFEQNKPSIGFKWAIVESSIWGCTAVMNREARDLILKGLDRAKPISHDWWLYLVISLFGTIIYDSRKMVLYRQHASNFSGGYAAPLVRLRRRIARLRVKGLSPWREQACSLLCAYGNSVPEVKSVFLQNLKAGKSDLLTRIRVAFSQDWGRSSAIENFVFRGMIIFNFF